MVQHDPTSCLTRFLRPADEVITVLCLVRPQWVCQVCDWKLALLKLDLINRALLRMAHVSHHRCSVLVRQHRDSWKQLFLTFLGQSDEGVGFLVERNHGRWAKVENRAPFLATFAALTLGEPNRKLTTRGFALGNLVLVPYRHFLEEFLVALHKI